MLGPTARADSVDLPRDLILFQKEEESHLVLEVDGVRKEKERLTAAIEINSHSNGQRDSEIEGQEMTDHTRVLSLFECPNNNRIIDEEHRLPDRKRE